MNFFTQYDVVEIFELNSIKQQIKIKTMPSFPPDFEPNKAAMHKWFGTRKKPMIFGTVELPGFFQTHGYSTDTIKMCILFILELMGAFAMMYEGAFSLYSIIPICFAIIVDVFLAVLLHKNEAIKLENKNRAKATNNPELAKKFEELSKQGIFFQNMIKLSIYTLAILKGIGYFFFVGDFEPQVILMFLIYLIIANLHINTTGYWVAEYVLNQSIKKQVKSNILSLGKSNPAIERVSTFTSEAQIQLINIGKHSIIKSDTPGEYQLKTMGVLTDNELATMVANQKSINLQSIVATACIKHQIENILLGS